MTSLTTKQLEAINLLATGKTHVETAASIGVAPKTIQRWSKRPEFAQALANVQSRVSEKALETVSSDIAGHLDRLTNKALETLESVLNDPESKSSDRLRACQIVGTWAGLNQPVTKNDTSAEQNFKDYLNLLATKNNGSNNHNPIRQ